MRKEAYTNVLVADLRDVVMHGYEISSGKAMRRATLVLFIAECDNLVSSLRAESKCYMQWDVG